MKIKNTAEGRVGIEALFAPSGSIEAQEAEGQKQLVESKQLPAEGLEELLEAFPSVTDRGPSQGDELFHDVGLPVGWALKATDHSMWSELVDDQGRTVANIFYKAAFYDRRAFLRMVRV